MLNSIILVGKIETLPEIKETSRGHKLATLGLLLDRPFKNMNGEQNVTLWRGIAEMVCDLSAIGDIVGVKGRIQANSYTAKDGNTYHHLEIIAEKVSFLDKARRMNENEQRTLIMSEKAFAQDVSSFAKVFLIALVIMMNMSMIP